MLRRLAFCLGLGIAATAFASTQAASEVPERTRPYFDEYLKQLGATKDFLGMRVFLKAYAQKGKKSARSWRVTRALLDQTPRAGFDLLFLWKHVAPIKRNDKDRIFLEEWEASQAAMLKGDFAGARTRLEALARQLRTELDQARGKTPVTFRNLVVLYPYVLHALGRARYGAGDYRGALEVYEWIPSGYGSVRQVYFERMWAAYQLGDASRALAAIAAQTSAYLSPFLEPEAYLIQTYLYKRLCRQEELAAVLKELRQFHEELKSGTFDLAKWAAWDMENYSLYQLLDKSNAQARNGIPESARLAEIKKIFERLNRNYLATRGRLQRDIGKVIAFASMAALSNTTRQLQPIAKLPDRSTLLRQGLEIWPYDRGEEWVDEIGTQYFLGESQCAGSAP